MTGRRTAGTLREALSGVRGEIRWNEPMARHTSFKVGGPADAMVYPRDREDLSGLLRRARRFKVPVFPFGGGTNLLVRDGGMRGIVLNLSRWQAVRDDGLHRLYVDGGARIAKAAMAAMERSLSGLEFAIGIPGTVGGTIMMNAGTPEGDMSQVVDSVFLLGHDGRVREVGRKEIRFGYRTSHLPPGIILGATFALKPSLKGKIQKRMDEYLRRRRETQPLRLPNAGSIFKNPGGDFAGHVIEDVGLKGCRRGGAQVSDKHANFIVNHGRANASDILGLIRTVGKKVEEEKGITLELEIRIVGVG